MRTRLVKNREKGLKRYGYTEKAAAMLKMAGADDAMMKDIASTIWNLKRFGHDIDTSDNAIKFKGVQLSFIRNNKTGEVSILLPEEARRLDSLAI